MAPPSDNVPVQSQRVFRWLNFGSCMMRYAFDTPEFFKQNYLGLPLQVSKIWRREIGSLMSDWDVSARFAAPLPPSQFSEAWLSSKQIFQDADVILVDMVLDIFQNQCLRFAREGEADFVPYERVIGNFPEEPPEGLDAKIGIFPCDQASSLRAWERFGEEVDTPTVFITYEHRDDIAPGYPERFRGQLLDYQAEIERLAPRFPHWLVINMDEVFAEIGPECYVDRHHPSELGWKVLREAVMRLIEDTGVLRPEFGGAPLPMGVKYVPERADFGPLDPGHIKLLGRLGASACVVGPPRLTRSAKAAYAPNTLEAFNAFGALKDKQPSLIIVLKWDQPIKLLPWISGLMKQHPDAVIEIPCLWKSRLPRFISEQELSLRQDIKRFGAENSQASIDYAAVAAARRTYVARCLMRTHRAEAGSAVLQPAAGAASGGKSLPEALAAALARDDLIPVFDTYI